MDTYRTAYAEEANQLLTAMVEDSEAQFGRADEDDVHRYADAVLQITRERYGVVLSYDKETQTIR